MDELTDQQEAAFDALRNGAAPGDIEAVAGYRAPGRTPHATSPGAQRKAVAYAERILKGNLTPRRGRYRAPVDERSA